VHTSASTNYAPSFASPRQRAWTLLNVAFCCTGNPSAGHTDVSLQFMGQPVGEKTECCGADVSLNAFLFYGASPRLHEHGDSDYIDLRSRRSLQPELPGSFGGVSGADLWRFDIGRLALADTSPSIFVYPALLSFSCPNRIPIFWRLVTTDDARSSNVSCHEFVKR
jgi:hypothetical protein